MSRTAAPFVNLCKFSLMPFTLSKIIGIDLRNISSSRPLNRTACRPFGVLPSVMTANDKFFCLRMDLIHPETVVDPLCSMVFLGARSCLIFWGKENFEPDAVDERSRRVIMVLVPHARLARCLLPLSPTLPVLTYNDSCSEP